MFCITYLYPNLTIDLHVRTAYEPPPEFPLASPYSGIVHHLSGPNMYAHTQTFLPKNIGRRIVPHKVQPLLLSLRIWGCPSYTRTYVRLLGPCFKTGWIETFRQHHEMLASIQARTTPSSNLRKDACLLQGYMSRPKPMLTDSAPQRPCDKSQRKNGTETHCFHSLPFQQFQVLFNSLFKVLCIFPSQYLYAIGLLTIFSFTWSIPRIWAAIPSNSTRRRHVPWSHIPRKNGSVTLSAALFQET